MYRTVQELGQCQPKACTGSEGDSGRGGSEASQPGPQCRQLDLFAEDQSLRYGTRISLMSQGSLAPLVADPLNLCCGDDRLEWHSECILSRQVLVVHGMRGPGDRDQRTEGRLSGTEEEKGCSYGYVASGRAEFFPN